MGSRYRTVSLLPVLLVALLAPSPAKAGPTDISQQIDAYLENAYPADQPGAAAIVTKDGKTIFRGAYGMADLELGISLEADMVLRLGSITKQFTGAAILLLIEEGKISLEDPLTKFLPDYPVHGHTITVAHLLSHSSGIRSYTEIPGWISEMIRKDLTVEELIDGFENEPMDFAPGDRFLPNNSAYVLLGAVIEKASGMSYADFVVTRIFEPLGMKSSYYGSHDRIIPKRAHGYSGSKGDWQNAAFLDMSQPYSAGALLSTVDDLARWDEALYSDALLSKESRESMVTPFELADGSSTDYAFGLGISELRGRKSISHSGRIFGFSTYAIRLPEEHVYVAVLSNAETPITSPGYAAKRIAAMAIGDPFSEYQQIELAPEILERYQGVYRIDESSTRTVELVNGNLHIQRTGGSKLAILPFSETGFFYANDFSYLEFVLDANGQVSHMLVYQDGSHESVRADLTD